MSGRVMRVCSSFRLGNFCLRRSPRQLNGISVTQSLEPVGFVRSRFSSLASGQLQVLNSPKKFEVHLGSSLQAPFQSRSHLNKIAVLPALWSRSISENNETKALTVWSDLRHIRSSPFPALAIGFSGLIPFASAPVFMIMSGAYLPWVVFAQTAYGAAILSFLGGVRWGFTLPEGSPGQPDWRSLSYSVLPSLIGWGALLCPEPVSSLTVMSGLAGLAYFDTTMYGYPPWFKALRFILSTFAVLSLWTSFVCRFILKKELSENKDDTSSQSSM